MAYSYTNEIKEQFEKSGFNLETLDDSEALALYLGGHIEDMHGCQGYPVFEFDEVRHIDSDNEGFREFASFDDEI
ncbi:MAG: hypothetical protein KDB22_14865 [Planctomycetales bacterium]|nr:hypothetical protein [Planctomycetales bacterium]